MTEPPHSHPQTHRETHHAELSEKEALGAIERAAKQARYGLYLGAGSIGPVFAPPEQAVLVLGPPRSGKTSALVTPCVLAAPSAVVSTSTKPDVLAATAATRLRKGPCFVYDPSGTVDVPDGVEEARWSPIARCKSWDEALMVAGSLVASVRPAGFTSRADAFDHWTERAQALLAPLLHAAALERVEMAEVLKWIDRRESSHALRILERKGREGAIDQLAGIAVTEAREQSSIWSTTSGVLSAYRSEAALATTVAPNFDARSFVESNGTLYICATGSRQALVAPLVVSMLNEIRDETYRRFAGRVSGSSSRDLQSVERTVGSFPPIVFALDEVANIAPLPDLPTMVSEGGGQGLVTLACLQDLSQARARWGSRADGFLSLFGTTVVLAGIGDVRTLDSLCTLAGEREVQTQSISAPAPERSPGITEALVTRLVSGRFPRRPERTPTITTSLARRRLLPPDVISRGRPGCALMVDEHNQMSWVGLTRAFETRPWCAVVEGPHAARGRQAGREQKTDPGRRTGRARGHEPGPRRRLEPPTPGLEGPVLT